MPCRGNAKTDEFTQGASSENWLKRFTSPDNTFSCPVDSQFGSAQAPARMDVLTLARIQFGATIAFHYLYPPLSISLGVLLVIMEGLWLKTKNPVYHQMARF
jgi:hypothetical protein